MAAGYIKCRVFPATAMGTCFEAYPVLIWSCPRPAALHFLIQSSRPFGVAMGYVDSGHGRVKHKFQPP